NPADRRAPPPSLKNSAAAAIYPDAPFVKSPGSPLLARRIAELPVKAHAIPSVEIASHSSAGRLTSNSSRIAPEILRMNRTHKSGKCKKTQCPRNSRVGSYSHSHLLAQELSKLRATQTSWRWGRRFRLPLSGVEQAER